MLNYEKLSAELSAKIKYGRENGSLTCIAFNEDNVIRQDINKSSPIFTHHINYINKAHYKRETPYEQTEPHQIVVDYIASMTDDYFVDLYAHLFPEGKLKITYKGYFD